jgi:hypothetical protein
MDIMPIVPMPSTISTTIVKPKPSYKNIMANLMKPLPKDDTKPNIHLGGGQFSKIDKI